MKQYIKNNEIRLPQDIIVEANDKRIINPTEAQILADGWEVYEPVVEPYKPTYEERVEQLVRERYSLNEELAIQRQRDTKVDEFNEYYAYCEECKQRAKEEQL